MAICGECLTYWTVSPYVHPSLKLGPSVSPYSTEEIDFFTLWYNDLLSCSQGPGGCDIYLTVFYHSLHLSIKELSIYYAPSLVLDLEKSNKVMAPEAHKSVGMTG